MLNKIAVRALLSVLAFLSLAISAVARDIPFDFVDGYILVHASVNAHPVTLLLDSGASASVLSLKTARRLHLRLGNPQPVDGVDAGATAFSIMPVTASAQSTQLGEFALAIDLRNAARLCSEPIDGLIGAGFFDGRVTQIDYANHRLRLLGCAPVEGATLPLIAKNGVYCLPVSVNGSKPRWTRLDTGCNDALHWVVPRVVAATSQRRGASIGFITDTSAETLVSIRLGDITLPHVAAALHCAPIFPGEAGLLGSEVLSQYRVTIDTREDRILFAPASVKTGD